MGTTTGIEWTDSTWNPLRGCSHVSEGCRNCYAERMVARFSGPGGFYEGLTENGHWSGKVELVEKHLLDPLKWGPMKDKAFDPEDACEFVLRERPRRIFVNSMSDLFHPNVPDEWIDRIFAVMALCPQHIFQVLTKRPERMLKYLTYGGRTEMIGIEAEYISGLNRFDSALKPVWILPLPNVWLGVSVENQAAADERIPILLQTPAAKRFVSCEPMLRWIDLRCLQHRKEFEVNALTGDHGVYRPLRGRSDRKLDWVICGGESGPGARPMHPDWARGLRDQCAATRVPFFFKSWGEWIAESQDYSAAGLSCKREFLTQQGETLTKDQAADIDPMGPCFEIMARVGKKATGCLLDGKEYKAFPEVSA